MSSYFSRIFKRKGVPTRYISQLTKNSFNLRALFSQCLQQLGYGQRKISQSPVSMGQMPDPMELATGIEKRELLLREAGCEDPWCMYQPLKRGAGTANEPTPIPSAFEGRLVGCICLDDRFVKWMWLEKGESKRCECGHYFVLKSVPPI